MRCAFLPLASLASPSALARAGAAITPNIDRLITYHPARSACEIRRGSINGQCATPRPWRVWLRRQLLLRRLVTALCPENGSDLAPNLFRLCPHSCAKCCQDGQLLRAGAGNGHNAGSSEWSCDLEFSKAYKDHRHF